MAFIPARAGSKGIPGKNMKLLKDKPLIQYTIEAAQQSKHIDEIFISTDDDKVIELARSLGVDVFYKRPPELATDTSDIMDAIFHALNWKKERSETLCDALVLLQATSPLRNCSDIDGAIEQYIRNKVKSLISVSEMMEHPYECVRKTKDGWVFLAQPKMKLTRRQDYIENFYFINGAIYIYDIKNLEKKTTLFEKTTDLYIMSQTRAIDIDNYYDLNYAKYLLENDNNFDCH